MKAVYAKQLKSVSIRPGRAESWFVLDWRRLSNAGRRVMKVLGRFNPLDFSCVVVLLLMMLGFFLAKADCAGVDQAIVGKPAVTIEIYLAGLKTKNPDMFKPGELTSLTIRNQPVEPPLKISAVKHWPKQASFVSPKDGTVFAAPDPSQTLAHDFVITLGVDKSEQSKDGYVVCGQKIKIGNQVELESFNYRVQGVVVDINANAKR